MTRLPTPIRICAVAAALALAACGGENGANTDDAPTSDPAAGQPDSPPDSGRQEVDGPRPRLVVAHEEGADVLDPESGEALATFDTDSAPRLTPVGDGRHVALVQADAGRTEFLDAGAWSAPHGDHFHHYVSEPALRSASVDGPRPVHVVSNDGRTAVFHDGSGEAEVFDDDALLIDSLDASTVDSGAPHHGVVVPVEGGALVSVPGPDALPVGVALTGSDGTEQARFEDCPELHGEVVVDDTAVFGCADGLMLVTGTDATTIANPDGSGERVGAFAYNGDGTTLVGDYADDSLAVIDVAAGTMDVVDAGGVYGPYALGPDGEIVVLGIDGTLRTLDPAGDAVGSVQVLEPFDLPEGHGGVQPSLAVVDSTAYVADPEASVLVPVDLRTMTPGEAITLDAAPTDLVAIGTAP